VDCDTNDDGWVYNESFTKPRTLSFVSGTDNPQAIIDIADKGEFGKQLQALPAYFNADGLVSEQHFVKSKDGTEVPYFIVYNKDKKAAEGALPTILYGYGGFEVTMTPSYMAASGAAWLEKGGCWVLSNIRGGGEYGPKWHDAALKENRQRAYEDFEAVGRDLISKSFTTKDKLSCMGGSNGGLLTGNMLVREGNADLFKAIVCQCPLLDMKRYHMLLAGNSWMGEYGDPDDADYWEKYLQHFSPFHMVKDGATYPSILFTTSTKDDRVHPAHARKLVALLQDKIANSDDVWYYENIEGGHSGAADNKQRAFMKTLEFMYLWEKLS